MRKQLTIGVVLTTAWLGTAGAHAAVSVVNATPEAFRTHVAVLRDLVGACEKDVADCNADRVGPDERVDALHFDMHWQWLRQELDHAKKAKDDERRGTMRAARARLDEIAAEGSGAGEPAAQQMFAKARPEATRILDSSEFRGVKQFSWWQKLKARVLLWLARLFRGVRDWGVMGDVLLALMILGGAVGLMFLLMRVLTRQRVAIAHHATQEGSAWDRESQDWAAQADASAKQGDFRDAVHCLYWAAIVMLEARRAWRHNPTRTPREYVRLLKPGSAQQSSLRSLTQMLERLWYGLREARREDYERARGLYESLRTTSASATEAA